MRYLFAGVLFIPLSIVFLLAFVSVEQFGFVQRLGFPAYPWVPFSTAAGAAVVTLYLVGWRFFAPVTFLWLFYLGLLFLCLAMVQLLGQIELERTWDPYNLLGYRVMSTALGAFCNIIVGLGCLITAVIQDLLAPLWKHWRSAAQQQRRIP